jgi:hypothetical protein
MKTTSTTQSSILKTLSILIVFVSSIYNGSLKAHPTTYASIGDFVWVDQNANGIQDAGEPGVANVTVKLLNASGTVVATTTTNASGKYLFSNVYVPQPAQFRVQFGTPGQYTWTTQTAPGSTVTNNSNADANGLTPLFTVAQGDYNTCIDAGIIQTPGGKATIGDYVWFDKNSNGIQDAGERGAPNVTVKLLNSAGVVIATTTTDASGIYFFSNITISSCGQYRVQFGNPGQYTWTIENAPGSTVTNNSNADANGLTPAFTVCPGDYNTCIDAGIAPSGGPLPLTLTKFQGDYLNGSAKLSWSTGFETSHTKFEVERSNDGSHFTSLSSINGQGVSSGSKYTFTDNLPLSGDTYYRLKMYDGGGFQYSNIIKLNTTVKGINVKLITANPFVNQIKVNVATENAGIVNVTLTDYLGRTISTQNVQAQKGSNEISVNNVNNLVKGVYNLHVAIYGQATSIKLMKD